MQPTFQIESDETRLSAEPQAQGDMVELSASEMDEVAGGWVLVGAAIFVASVIYTRAKRIPVTHNNWEDLSRQPAPRGAARSGREHAAAPDRHLPRPAMVR